MNISREGVILLIKEKMEIIFEKHSGMGSIFAGVTPGGNDVF